ncbi:MAG: septation protein IspZ, partial [Pseudomonadota bacterium]
IVNGLFAATLGLGLLLKKPLLQVVLEGAFDLTDLGWRRVTLAWTLFFVFMAVLNELLWRNLSTDAWVTFKTFGSPAITFVFAIGLTPLLTRHATERDEDG